MLSMQRLDHKETIENNYHNAVLERGFVWMNIFIRTTNQNYLFFVHIFLLNKMWMSFIHEIKSLQLNLKHL